MRNSRRLPCAENGTANVSADVRRMVPRERPSKTTSFRRRVPPRPDAFARAHRSALDSGAFGNAWDDDDDDDGAKRGDHRGAALPTMGRYSLAGEYARCVLRPHVAG